MPRLDELLAQTSSSDPSTQELISKLRLFLQKRFWHEFGETLTALLYSKPAFNSLPLIEAAIAELPTYLDPFLTAELADVHLHRSSAPLAEKLAFIVRAKELLSKSELALQYLGALEARSRFSAEDFEAGLAALLEAEKTTDRHRAVPKVLFAALSQARLLYHFRKQDFPRFYDSVVKFLAYGDEQKMTEAERLELAEKTLRAAAISDQILTFGDVLGSPFFARVAEGSGGRHLWQLVGLLSKGDVAQFERFLQSNWPVLQADSLLAPNIEKLKRKVRVIALYDFVFSTQKSFSQQSVSFQEIANIARIDKREVEKLIVHVLSIGLLKGYVDELNELFFITGLKPQDLDAGRLRLLKEKFGNWNQNIKASIDFVNRC